MNGGFTIDSQRIVSLGTLRQEREDRARAFPAEHRFFWQLTLTTLAVGWLGTNIALNIAAYVRSLSDFARA